MEAKTLTTIARQAIEAGFEGQKPDLDAYKNDTRLWQEGASFVTLTIGGELRGCIGSLLAHRPLIEDITANAQNAAFQDPRFAPLDKEEFAKVSVEISVLSAPKELIYEDKQDLLNKIEPFVDGLILKQGAHQGTFLPSVWEQLPNPEDFLANLCMKSGLGADCIDSHPDIYTYRAHKYSE